MLWRTADLAAPPDPARTGVVHSLAIAPDGRLVTGAETDWAVAVNRDGLTATGGDALVLGNDALPEPDPVYALSFTPDGTVLAAGTQAGSISLWNVPDRTRDALLTGHDGPVAAIAHSPDGAVIATAGADGTIRFWDTDTREPLGEPLRGHGGEVLAIAFSPDGRLLASGGGDNAVRLWEVSSRRQVDEGFWGHADPVRAVAFSPDGTRLASAGEDRVVRLWDVSFAADPLAAVCAQAGRSMTEDEWARHVPDVGFRDAC